MAGTWADWWPALARCERAAEWLQIWADLGRAPRTIDAYARGLGEYLEACERDGIDPLAATRASVAVFVRELTSRPCRSGVNVVALDSGAGLANATLQQRLVPVRLFYDFLVEEGLRESNPVGRGRHAPGRRFRGGRAVVPRMVKPPWIPSEAEWLQVLAVFRAEPVRNRLMLALAYDAALRREELCCLRTADLDPAHRMLRVRAETTKTRRERVVPYSAPTGLLLADHLHHRAAISRARGPLFLSESRRNHAEPLSLWTWSKVVRRVALEAEVPRFSTHTTRHLCLTDLARMGWEVHAIAIFALDVGPYQQPGIRVWKRFVHRPQSTCGSWVEIVCGAAMDPPEGATCPESSSSPLLTVRIPKRYPRQAPHQFGTVSAVLTATALPCHPSLRLRAREVRGV
jgi:integrase/recombinase XerD